ncbi:MAG: hypothetical protein NTU63_01860 [Candidatus Pacearchaeota archaeon]|nr:hypothetical protein [Candidatus Pacearchaeota archaeon]
MNFIKKVFDDKIDEDIHLQFQKFSRGEFIGRALIRAKKSGNKFTIFTTAEFANELVRIVAEKIGDEKVGVTGAVISTSDLGNELEFKSKKQFMGIKQYIIEKEMSGNEIVELLKKLPRAFFALSFNGKENVLKIKPKAPKSAKPKNKDDKQKPDFCKLITNDEKIGKDFIFEKSDFKEADISHDFIIEEIIIPKELKKDEDFAKIREMAKRKGKIIRKAVIDEKEIRSEKEFEA